MTSGSLPPASWYPDPGGSGGLRYWDGARWTEHLAPDHTASGPGPEPGAVAGGGAAASSAPGGATRPPRGSRAWTLRTVIVLLVCLALLIATPIVLLTARADAYRDQAEAVLDRFMSAAVDRDPDWRTYATPGLSQKVEVGAPIGGEPVTAAAIGLNIEYDLGELSFEGPSSWSGADDYDLASAPVTLHYSYDAYGKRQSGTAKQVVWLTRPFYYGSQDAQRADARRTPSQVGPWRVTSLTLPDAGPNAEDDREQTFFTSDLSEPYDAAVDGNICFDPVRALQQLSEVARIDGTISSSCVPLSENHYPISQGFDADALASAFPVIDALKPQFAPRELTGLDPRFSAQLPPIMEYHLKTAKGEYVIVFASTELEGEQEQRMAARLITITELGAGEQR